MVRYQLSQKMLKNNIYFMYIFEEKIDMVVNDLLGKYYIL